MAVSDNTHLTASNIRNMSRKSVRQDLIAVINIWLKFRIAAPVASDTRFSYLAVPAVP